MLLSAFATCRSGSALPSAVVYYYFQSIDDLIVSLYRRAAETYLREINEPYEEDGVIRQMFDRNVELRRSSLLAQLNSLGNHRKLLRADLIETAKRERGEQAKALEFFEARGPLSTIATPVGIGMFISAASRCLVSEADIGVSYGHAEAKAVIDWLIRLFDEPFSPPS